MKTREARRDMLERQNGRFVRDFLQFSHFGASKSTCSCEFSFEPPNLLPQNQCFVRGFRKFLADVTKYHACHGICPLRAALTTQFAKTMEHVKRAPATQNAIGGLQSAAHGTKKRNAFSENRAKVSRLPRKTTFDTS